MHQANNVILTMDPFTVVNMSAWPRAVARSKHKAFWGIVSSQMKQEYMFLLSQ